MPAIVEVVYIPPVFSGDMDGWYLLTPSGYMRIMSPSSRAFVYLGQLRGTIVELVRIHTSMILAIDSELSTGPSLKSRLLFTGTEPVFSTNQLPKFRLPQSVDFAIGRMNSRLCSM